MTPPSNLRTPPVRTFHPQVRNTEIWPGPAGYPWADSGLRLWTREGLLRRVGTGDDLLCTWTTGGVTEPWLGNFTMIARSSDNGATWEDAGAFQHPTRGLFTTELFVPGDCGEEVHAFLNTYSTGVWMTQLLSFRVVSGDGGRTWDGPHSIPGGAQGVWPNRGIVHSSGRWIVPVSWAEMNGGEWSEPHVGRTPQRGQIGARFFEPETVPAGADVDLQYARGNAWADRNHRYVCGALLSDDDGGTFRQRGYLRGGVCGLLMEPRVVELSDGRVVMLIRSQRDGRLWRCDSEDAGETWSVPVRTDIPNPAAKVLLLRARDGRIFMIHNPVANEGDVMRGRNPLSLWVSEDDMKTWPVQVELVRDADPRATLNYPDGFIDETRRELVVSWEDTYSVFLLRIPMNIA